MSDSARAAEQCDALGAAYAASNADGAFNAYYERPATISLLGDVAGLRVVDVGCGPGALSEWLVDHGATVTAIDVSPEMVRIANRRLGARVQVTTADIGRPLTFIPDGSVDLVVASLVLHYLKDWTAVLREFRRILVVDGAVVFSTHHPTMDWQSHSPENYFATKQVTEEWTRDGRPFEVTFWRRPLTAMTESIAEAGFVIESLVEPKPLSALRERDPEAYARIRTELRFLFFRLRSYR